MEKTPEPRSEQEVLCDIVSLLESNKITQNADIAYICSRLLNPDKIRGVKRSVTMKRQKQYQAFQVMLAGMGKRASKTVSSSPKKKAAKASR